MIMTQRYQNIGFNTDKSTFIGANEPKPEITFSAKRVNVALKNGIAPMVKATVSLRQEQAVTPCGSTCAESVMESAQISFSILRGDDASLTALRSELNRLVDAALANYLLTDGYVPPVYAAFEVA